MYRKAANYLVNTVTGEQYKFDHYPTNQDAQNIIIKELVERCNTDVTTLTYEGYYNALDCFYVDQMRNELNRYGCGRYNVNYDLYNTIIGLAEKISFVTPEMSRIIKEVKEKWEDLISKQPTGMQLSLF